MGEGGVYECSEPVGLPVEWRDGADLVSSDLLHRIRVCQLDVSRTDGLFEVAGDSVLAGCQHHQDVFPGLGLEDECLDHLGRCTSQGVSYVGGSLLCFRRKR